MQGALDRRTRRTKKIRGVGNSRVGKNRATTKPFVHPARTWRRAMREGVADSPGVFLFTSRHWFDEIERGHCCSARKTCRSIHLHREVTEKARPADCVLRPCRRRKHSYERDGGLYETRREVA